ncbi:hypothetical protein RB195_022438 [Necator americanus]|uniref:Uncharacterized protein n=1 Tax=Necator americanus TaxID=51031 RepID=A0ABR1EFB4_NECAM
MSVWSELPRSKKSRYLHLDHEAFKNRPLKFAEAHAEISFEVDSDNMTPLCQMYPPVYDLNDLITKLHAQKNSK